MKKINWKFCAEWLGCLFGLAGAFVLAMNASYSGWGFVLFLLSNGFMITYGLITKARGIILMQLGFTATSAIGAANWLLK